MRPSNFHAIPGPASAAAICLCALVRSLLPVAAQPPARPPSPSTASLYVYHRNDADPVTHVRINAARRSATPIAQDIFGNFLEHLGNVVYGGVWADALLNPNLEKVEDRDSAPEDWSLDGSAVWQPGGYDSPLCVELAGPDGLLSQRIYLPVQRTRHYHVTLYVQAPKGAGSITVALKRPGDASDFSFVRSNVQVTGADWQKEQLSWQLPREAPSRGDAEQFTVRFDSGGPVNVDWITLFPDDAVDGMDPDVIRAARAWHIPILRMGGNFSSGYHWRDGIGPRMKRPTLRNPAWGGVESNEFGTDEFLEFCRLIHTVPQIAVNVGSGTPEEAADWVRYCNVPGHRVPVWEIGNELYGGWQIGHLDVEQNAARFLAFRDAMLKADPHIRTIATGKGDEFLPDGVGRDLAWNQALLQAAQANGPVPDYLSIHPLVPLPGGLQDLPYAERWQSAMAQPYYLDQTLAPSLIQQIQTIEGPGAHTRVAPTEWGIIIGGDRWAEGPNHNFESGAIFNALTLNAFLRHSDWITLANMTGLMHGGGIKKPNGVVIVDPQYYTQQLYSLAEPRTPVETVWEGPGEDVPLRGFIPQTPNVPDVDVFSALSGDRLDLFLVNRRLNDPRAVTVHVDDFPVGRRSATILTSTDPQAGNTWQNPDAVAPHPFPLPDPTADGDWTLTLPPHSLLVIRADRS